MGGTGGYLGERYCSPDRYKPCESRRQQLIEDDLITIFTVLGAGRMRCLIMLVHIVRMRVKLTSIRRRHDGCP